MAHQRLAALRTSGGGMVAVGALEQGRLADLLAAVRLGHDLNSQRNWGPLQTGLLIGIQLTQKMMHNAGKSRFITWIVDSS